MCSLAYVGMDVHRDTTQFAIIGESGGGLLDRCSLPTEVTAFTAYLDRWRSAYALQCFYEASGGGYVVQRWLTARGIACQVIAPSKMPRAPGDRVKTDHRDAYALAVQGRAGTLAPVHVPTEAEEAVRSLVRCREARRRDVQVAQQRLVKFLATRGRVFRAGTYWTQVHRRWLAQQAFHDADTWTYREYLGDLAFREQRLAETTQEVERWATQPAYAPLVGALTCFRGVSTLTAMLLIAETLDFTRFATAGAYMAYLGLTCRERSSGAVRQRGGITKTGNGRCRWALVEAAWHARHAPAVGERLRQRQMGQPPELIAHAWKAQKRLHATFGRVSQGGKEMRRAAVDNVRSFSHFRWGITV
jgi:transposase